MNVERRDEMIAAAESERGDVALRAVVTRLVAERVPFDVLLEDLEQIRPLVAEGKEDNVLDVMDLLTGYCGPDARLVPPPDP